MADGTPDNTSPGANAAGTGASKLGMTSAAAYISDPLAGSARVARSDTGSPDHAWVLRIMQSEGPGIIRLLWRILGREQDVMDAYQDCFCKLAARGQKGKLAHVKAYAYRTAANIAIELIRVRNRRATHLPAIAAAQEEASSGGENVVEPSGSAERLGRLRTAIAGLPDHLRNVVVMRDLSRMSYTDVARTLGITPATARVYRRHAVVRLSELLSEGSES